MKILETTIFWFREFWVRVSPDTWKTVKLWRSRGRLHRLYVTMTN